MNRYGYKAVNKTGDYVKGFISANNPAELAAILKNDGFDIINYKAENKNLTLFSSGKVRIKDLITTFVHLEQLDKAGVPIVDSIADLKETSDSIAIKSMMQDVYESIRNGSLFSEAMSKHPKIFSSVYVGLVASGEKTGNLAQAFSSIVEDLKWNLEFKRKVNKALIGPSFAIFMMLIIIGVMMGVVVPKVTGFLALQEIKLPPATTSLIAVSNFVQDYLILIILLIPSLFIGLKFLSKVPEVGFYVDATKLKIPVIGAILTKLDSARFCQFFAMTFRSGLGVIESLDASSMVIKNEAIKKNIYTIKVQVSEGLSLSKAIASSNYFPSLVVRMFRVGEESGNMEDALQNIKFFYDREINDSIDRLVSMIQPALTIFLGSLITWVIIAVFGPIYGSFAKIK